MNNILVGSKQYKGKVSNLSTPTEICNHMRILCTPVINKAGHISKVGPIQTKGLFIFQKAFRTPVCIKLQWEVVLGIGCAAAVSFIHLQIGQNLTCILTHESSSRKILQCLKAPALPLHSPKHLHYTAAAQKNPTASFFPNHKRDVIVAPLLEQQSDDLG
jgi:hypothetical protein